MNVLSDGRFWGGVIVGVILMVAYSRWKASKQS